VFSCIQEALQESRAPGAEWSSSRRVPAYIIQQGPQKGRIHKEPWFDLKIFALFSIHFLKTAKLGKTDDMESENLCVRMKKKAPLKCVKKELRKVGALFQSSSWSVV